MALHLFLLILTFPRGLKDWKPGLFVKSKYLSGNKRTGHKKQLADI